MGDSARRAVRASGLCMDAEVIVNSTVRDWVSRDFVVGGEDLAKQRTLPAKWEEDMQLFQLQSIHEEVVSSTTTPADFVYTLGRIGRRDAAVSAAVAIRERYEILSVPEDAHEEWNPGNLPNPNVVTPRVRHPVTSRSPFPAFKWNQVLDSLPDYAAAQALVEAMRKKGLPCDVATYAILMKKAPTIAEARIVMREMVENGVAPDVVGYSSLFSKSPGDTTAREILNWYARQDYHPSDPLNALLAVFRKAQRADDALELVLDHPHLSAAKRILLKYPGEAREKFQAALASNPGHPTADFALGALALAQMDSIVARECLQRALGLAPHWKQKETIQRWLGELETEAT